jgi:hypothetical protein
MTNCRQVNSFLRKEEKARELGEPEARDGMAVDDEAEEATDDDDDDDDEDAHEDSLARTVAERDRFRLASATDFIPSDSPCSGMLLDFLFVCLFVCVISFLICPVVLILSAESERHSG